jgi:hypothetical protein
MNTPMLIFCFVILYITAVVLFAKFLLRLQRLKDENIMLRVKLLILEHPLDKRGKKNVRQFS